MKRIGVFLCHCNLSPLPPAATEQVMAVIGKYPGVICADSCQDMCLNLGLEQIKGVVKERELDGVVLTTCSPSLHCSALRQAMASVGLDAHRVEVVDLKQPEIWNSGSKRQISVEEAIKLIRDSVDKLCQEHLFTTIEVPVIKRALVIGGGVAGIQAALDVADGGYEVVLVEKSPSIGGHMLQYSEVFPTLDCPQCIMTPKMVEVAQHPNIRLLAYSEVEEVSGEIGNFKVKIKRKTPYVDWDKCTGCGDCINVCPVEIDSEFERGVAPQKAVNKLFAQAVPNKVVIYKKGMSPCRVACPARVNAHGYTALISQGKFKEALDVVRDTLPFPAICGRVCHHPCEEECNRKDIDEPVSTRLLHKFIADWARENGEEPPEAIQPTREEKVAIIGAGPSGFTCALSLLKRGYPVTILEASDKAGGMITSCIPDYRSPQEVANYEIDRILAHGMELKTNTKVGRDITLEKLREEYKAIYIGIGAQAPARLSVEGAEAKGVLYGLPFLRDVKSGKKVEDFGQRVIVIGGGNVAVDCAKSAIRLGAKSVHLVCLETRDLASKDRMPAHAWEIEEAEEEGVVIHGSLGPRRILSQKGETTGLETQVCTSVYEEDGRFAPKFSEEAGPTIEADTVIIAIGQRADLTGFEDLAKTSQGTIKVDEITLETSIPGVFAGGDIVVGPASVIEAVAHGNEAAESIDRLLNGLDLKQGRVREEQIAPLRETEVEKKERAKIQKRDPRSRVKGFEEIELGFVEEGAETVIDEAKRCLNCALCSECLECIKVCEPKVIYHQMGDRYEEIEVGAIIVATGFELLPTKEIQEYAEDPDIIDGIQFERLLCPGGPTAGVVVRPSDGKTPKEVVFISCVGSRDPELGVPYCSRVCCMYLVKQAMLYKHAVPDGRAYIFYIDTRTTGKGYEEFVQRAVEEGALYLRGKVSKIFRDGDKLSVWGVDTLSGYRVEVSGDLVVLGMAMIPSPGIKDLARKLGIVTDEHGFIAEIHPKLCPLETSVPGIYLAGTAQGPKDIPDSIAQASGAAGKVLSLFSQDEMVIEKVAVG